MVRSGHDSWKWYRQTHLSFQVTLGFLLFIIEAQLDRPHLFGMSIHQIRLGDHDSPILHLDLLLIGLFYLRFMFLGNLFESLLQIGNFGLLVSDNGF